HGSVPPASPCTSTTTATTSAVPSPRSTGCCGDRRAGRGGGGPPRPRTPGHRRGAAGRVAEGALCAPRGYAGIRGPVSPWDRPGPGALGPDEVRVEVRGGGVGNWDEIARTGGWDLGRRPPMALGVEAAGVVARAGGAVTGFAAGDRVMTHSLPLRAQGGWAEWFVAAAADVAAVPDAVPFEVAAALPVPALTADQVLHDA